MNKSWFQKRDKCPACYSQFSKKIYETPYTEPPIKDYLSEFYDSQGGVEFEYLENEIYSLVECNSCGMIYQETIPDSDLMKRLYEVWIDPKLAKEEENRGQNLDFYSEYAFEFF